MSELTVEPKRTELTTSSKPASKYAVWRWYMLPLVLMFAVDFLTPQLIDWGLMPRPVLWLSDLAIIIMIVITIMRMLMLDNIPITFLVVLAITILGVTVALLEGQSVALAAYGWRRLFQYPMVGLYVYMMPQWPPKSATWLMRICLLVLGVNTVVQIGQYAAGERPGDFLAGLFGPNGDGPLVLYICLIVGFGLGRWLLRGDSLYLLITLALGVVASALGEMKVFPVALLGLTFFALFFQLLRGEQISRIFVIVILFTLFIGAFVFVFNAVFRSVNGLQIQQYANMDTVMDYLTGSNGELSDGAYTLSRNSEIIYVWNHNMRSPANLLFGNGLGSRAESATLGLAGSWYSTSLYLAGPGRSLPVLLQETGMLGIVTFAILCLVIAARLFEKLKQNGSSDFAAVQYGLLLFTALWPLWLWYQSVWIQAIPMELYWMTLGFALNLENNQAVQEYNGTN